MKVLDGNRMPIADRSYTLSFHGDLHMCDAVAQVAESDNQDVKAELLALIDNDVDKLVIMETEQVA